MHSGYSVLTSNTDLNVGCEISVPQQTYEGAGGGRVDSSYSLSTSALDGGEWSASRPGRALSPETHCRFSVKCTLAFQT
jgi:hypothetical protein